MSSMGTRVCVGLLLFVGCTLVCGRASAQTGAGAMTAAAGVAAGNSMAAGDPKKLFEAGRSALGAGKLDEAERDFRQVLAIDPNSAAAYANLGVIHMRRKQWPQALDMLHQAQKLASARTADPGIRTGIRLNIGLVYFRQSQYGAAIKPFESVVKQAPESFQACYLLGLCYFFNDRWADTVSMLEPLWGKASNQMTYLYVLGRAAEKANRPELKDKAWGQLAEIGEGTPEFHLLVGKGHLQREEYDEAVTEFEAAAKGDPKLPFLHFNLGMAYVHKQDYDRAREEFRKDIALEPDLPFAYEQLGSLEVTVGNEDEAAKNYRTALKLDGKRINSLMGLAKIEEHEQHHTAALEQLDRVIALDSGNANARYMRGQVLVRMGRQKEGRQELAQATRMLNEARAKRHQELEGETVPSPELAREPE